MVFVHKVCFAATCCCNALWVFKLPLKSRHVHRINLPKRAKLWIISPMCIDMWAYGIVSYFAHSTLGFLFFFLLCYSAFGGIFDLALHRFGPVIVVNLFSTARNSSNFLVRLLVVR